MVQYHLSGTLANQCVGRARKPSLSVPTMTDVMWATAAADLQVCVPLGTLRYMASLDGTDCAALVAELFAGAMAIASPHLDAMAARSSDGGACASGRWSVA